MKRTLWTMVAVMTCAATVLLAEEFRNPVVFKNDVDFDTGANLKIQGTKVTSTAAQLNAAAGGSTATLTPTLVSNATLKVYGQVLEVVSGGTVTLPAASIASAALPAAIANSTLTASSVSDGTLASTVVKSFAVVTQNVAAAGTITPAPDTVFYLTPTGMALDATATITLNNVAPTYSGKAFQFWIACSGTATGLVGIARTGTFYGITTGISTGQVANFWSFGDTNKFYGK